MVTTKTNSTGTVVWSTEYNGTLSSFDYGSAICLDASGNIFVAGATHNTSSYTFDIVVIKYNSFGVEQWSNLFDGNGNGMDIPSGITLDGSGNIYVCGASTGSTTGYDYVTMKLNSSGTTQWTKTYDYANLSDLPGYIEWSSTNSKIGIAGASQSSTTNWDYTIIKYDASGNLTNTNRTNTAGYGFDRPTGLVTDAADNVLGIKMVNATSIISYQIFNLDGKLIVSSNSASSETGIFTIDTSGLISGLYYLNIRNADVSNGVKFVKK